MKICLKTRAKEASWQTLELAISDRLPPQVEAVDACQVHYQVKSESDYYLLQRQLRLVLQLHCQRCMQLYPYHFEQELVLAICEKEARAESLMANYDTVVASRQQIDLLELVTDDLHLHAPERHPSEMDCEFH